MLGERAEGELAQDQELRGLRGSPLRAGEGPQAGRVHPPRQGRGAIGRPRQEGHTRRRDRGPLRRLLPRLGLRCRLSLRARPHRAGDRARSCRTAITRTTRPCSRSTRKSTTGAIRCTASCKKAGPDHDRTFWVSCEVAGAEYGPSAGKNKKEAEQSAAQAAYDAIMAAAARGGGCCR